MQSVDSSGLKDLQNRLDNLLQKSPEMRYQLHNEMAKLLKDEVDRQINTAGFKDGGTRLRGWQESRVGTHGGYAAIRPVRGQTGANSPGAITNYNENGHKIRSRKSADKRYKPKIRTPYVSGRHFYNNARASAATKIEKLIDDFTKELSEAIGGGT